MLCSRGSHEGIRNDLDQSVNGATAQSPTAGQRLVFSPPLEEWRALQRSTACCAQSETCPLFN